MQSESHLLLSLADRNPWDPEVGEEDFDSVPDTVEARRGVAPDQGESRLDLGRYWLWTPLRNLEKGHRRVNPSGSAPLVPLVILPVGLDFVVEIARDRASLPTPPPAALQKADEAACDPIRLEVWVTFGSRRTAVNDGLQATGH